MLVKRHPIVMRLLTSVSSRPSPWVRGAYLRPLVEEDLPELVALEELCYDGFLAWTLKDFRTDFRYNLYAIYWVLEIDGHIQGLISGRCQQKTAHISHLFIHPRFRRQGYARRLVQRWCRCVSQIGSRRVTLEVRATNQAAQSLYQGLGFEIERLVPNYYHTMQEDALFMVYDCQQ
mgnify:CR=1 FL=1